MVWIFKQLLVQQKIELKKIFKMQKFLDYNLLSDHYRVVLKNLIFRSNYY